MTVCVLVLALSVISAFMGRMLIYCTQFEEFLRYWAYGFYALAAVLAVTFIYEVIRGICRGIWRLHERKGARPPRPRRRRRLKH